MSAQAMQEEAFEDLYSSSINSNNNHINNKSHGLDDRTYGNTMKYKVEEDTRVAIINVNTFPWRKGKKE